MLILWRATGQAFALPFRLSLNANLSVRPGSSTLYNTAYKEDSPPPWPTPDPTPFHSLSVFQKYLFPYLLKIYRYTYYCVVCLLLISYFYYFFCIYYSTAKNCLFSSFIYSSICFNEYGLVDFFPVCYNSLLWLLVAQIILDLALGILSNWLLCV